ncbi:MAG: hypothetical protein ACTSQG_09490 [Promethearchaeota archaeon]
MAKYESAKIIEGGNINSNYSFTFKREYSKETNINFNNTVLIGSNSKYIFLFDKKLNKAYIIPREYVLRIEIKK